MWILQSSENTDQARHAEAEHRDEENGQDAGHADLDVVDHKHRHTKVVHGRLFGVGAAIVVIPK